MDAPVYFSWRHWWNIGFVFLFVLGFAVTTFFNLSRLFVIIALFLYLLLGLFSAPSIFYEHLGFFTRAILLKPEKAASYYTKAVDIGGATPQGLAALGILSFSEGDLKSAESFLKESLKKMPDDQYLKNLLSQTLLRQGRFQESENMALESRLEPFRSYGLAETLFAQKDYEAAAASYQKALKAAPEHAESVLGLARSLYFLGDFTAADTEISRVLSKNPNNPDLLFWRGRLLEALGRKGESTGYYRDALIKRSPDDHAWSVSYQEIVKSIGGQSLFHQNESEIQ